MRTILQRLSVTLVFSLLCLLTVTADEVTIDSLKYTLNASKHTAYVSGYVNGIKVANIPQTIIVGVEEYKVNCLGYKCFSDCSSLTSVTIPESVTSTGTYCFKDCNSLTNVTIPKSLKTLEEGLFYNCRSLKSITIPKGVTKLERNCFFSCTSLSNISIPEGVTSLGYKCFSDCSSLTSITIPESVTSTGTYCFKDCNSLTNVTIPKSLKTLEEGLFYNCRSLKSITIPKGVTKLERNCFFSCSSLTNITIPEGVTSFGDQCFSYCSSLTNITIPEGVTSLGCDCFYDCGKLRSITLPHTIKYIDSDCFNFVGDISNPCKLYIDDQFPTAWLVSKGTYYNMRKGVFVIPVQSIKLLSNPLYVGKGHSSQKVNATVVPAVANNTNIKVTSENTSVVTIGDANSIVANAFGEADVRYEAADGNGAYAICHVKVITPADSIHTDISQKVLLKGQTYKPEVTVYPSTTMQQTIMTTSDAQVATIDSTGTITAAGPGEADIRYEAYDNSEVFAQIHVQVYNYTDSIRLSAMQTTLAVGQEFKPVISVYPSQASPHLKTSSSNENVAKVDDAGKVSAVGLGEAIIRYESYDNSEVFVQLKVKVYAKTDSVKLDISQKDLIIGKSYKPNIIIYPAAAIQHLTMNTSNPRVATIDSTGVITAVGFGEADIRYEAFDNSEVYALLHVNVYMPTDSVKLDVASKDILIGQTYQPVFRVYPTTANQKVKVFSSNSQVATVDSTGTITAIAPGEADIRYEAFDNSEVYATLHVNVYSLTDTIVLSDYELHLVVGQSYGNMKAKILPETAMHELDVSSNGAGVAYVNDKGEVIAGEYGECDITFEAKDGTGKSSKCHVYVTYPTENITVSTTELNTNPGEVFKAQQITYKPDLCRHEVRYSSSNEQVATVDSLTGDVTAVAPGEADIKYEAKDGTGVFATMHVKVWPRTESITPATTTLSMRLGDVYTKQTVDVLPKGAYQKLKLESEDQTIASVDENGVITAVNPGITDILYVAQDSSKVVGKCRVIVCAKNVVYVGGIFYLLKDGKATVTSIYGGVSRGDDANDIAQYYSGTINIPKTVTYNGMVYDVEEIGSYSFYCQNKLQSIYIPSSVKTISMMAAMQSTSLQLVTVEDNSQLVNIGSEAFEKCTGLLRFTFNGTTLKMKSIDPSAFSECTALQRVRWKGESTLSMIDDYAFYRCSSLNHMEMPNSVVRIGKHAFRYNTSLTDVKLAKRLSIIDEYAFGECGFSHITLPDSIASAQAGAFINNEHLKSITIPAGMEGIGAACFENNAVLDSVTFLTNIHTLTIGNNAFNLCPALERVNIAHLDSWAETNFNNAKANPANTAHHIYKDGKEVLDVVLPQGTQYVNNNAFNGCTYIRSVDMPSSIDHINDDIFVGCDSLKAVYCRAEEVPLFIGVNDPSAMNDVFNRATLYVPYGYEMDYKSNDWWGRFYKIQGFNAATGISGFAWDGDGKARYYDLSGRLVGSRPTAQGVYIKVENGKRTKVTIK